jgi:hypothetical protein
MRMQITTHREGVQGDDPAVVDAVTGCGVEKEPQSGCSTCGSLRQASIRQTALVRGYTPDSR